MHLTSENIYSLIYYNSCRYPVLEETLKIGVVVASRRYKRKTKSWDFTKTLLFILLLAAGTAAGFLYQSNKEIKMESQKLQSEVNRLKSRLDNVREEMRQKEEELAELKIQAVIKDSKSMD